MRGAVVGQQPSRTDENVNKASAIQLKSGETIGSCTMTTCMIKPLAQYGSFW